VPRVSRRQFLLGGLGGVGVAAVGAAAGLETAQGRRALRRLGLVHGVDGPVPRAGAGLAVERGVLAVSGRRFRLVRTGSGAGPVLAVACLHGRNNDEGFAFDSIGVHRFAAAAGLDVVVASLDGGAAEYWHRRRSGRDAMAALVDELVPRMDARSGGGPRAVLGWSMGGFGALLAGLEHPEVFSAVAAASPAVWRRAGDTSPGAFDGPEDFARHDVLARAGALGPDGRLRVRVRIDNGADDPFLSTTRELLRRVPGVAGGVRPGTHDAGFWRTLVPAQLAFLTTG
jgi:pimeloyl-ACP methyl ester carboxylesterase